MAMHAINLLTLDPALLFANQKFTDAVLPDIFQIINHAHLVFGAVALVYMLNAVAGKSVALKTVLPAVRFELAAILDAAMGAGI